MPRTRPPLGAMLDRTHPLGRGLVAAWLLNEGAGGTVNDSAGGTAGLGTLVGSGANIPAWSTAPEPMGRGLLFPGSTAARVKVPDLRPAFDQRFTVAGWCRWDTLASARFFSARADTTGRGFELTMTGVGGSVALSVYNGTAIKNAAGPSALTAGVPYHVAGVCDGTTIVLYANGVPGTPVAIAGTVAWAAASAGWALGTRADFAANPLAGAISSAWLWNRDLSAAEVRQHYADTYEVFTPRPARRYFLPAGAATFTGTGAVTLAGLAVVGTGTRTSPTKSGTGAVTLGGLAVIGTGTRTSPTKTGAGAVTLGGPAASGSATHTAPTRTAAGSVTLGGVAVAGAGTHTAPTRSATGSVILAGLAVAGSGTRTSPTRSATGAAQLGGLAASGSGSHTPVGMFGGAGSVAIAGLATAGTGTNVQHATAAGSVALAGLGASGSGTRTSPTLSGVGSVVLAGPVAAGTGTRTSAGIAGAGAAMLGGLAVAGSGTATGPAVSGAGSPVLAGLGVAGSGGHTPAGGFAAAGAITLGGVAVASVAESTDTSLLGNRDWDIILDIQARLDATGAFADVRLCVAPENRTPVAVVDQAEADEDDLGIQGELLRTARPVVSLLSRSYLPEDRMAELSRLASVVSNAVDGQSLAGLTIPGMTKTLKNKFKIEGQETTLTMQMEAAYIVPGPAGHDAAER